MAAPTGRTLPGASAASGPASPSSPSPLRPSHMAAPAPSTITATATSPSSSAAPLTTLTTTAAADGASAAPPVRDVFGAACPVDFSSLRGVLFDVDGTLTESDPLHFLAFQEILSEVGFNGGQPIDEAFFRAHISGRHNPEIAADLFPAWSEERRTQFYMDKEERYRRLAAKGLQPLEGLKDFLEWVGQRGLRRAAVTNAPRANAELMLASLGLDTYFEHLVLGEECTRAKPHPDPYLTAMELLDLTPADSLVFEDSPSGVAAGVAAGVPVIALTTGQEPGVLRTAGASWVVKDFRDVMAAVNNSGSATHGSA